MSRLLEVSGGQQLTGRVIPPPDKSVSHRVLFFAALGDGVSRIRPVSAGEDNRSTVRALESLGVRIEREGDELVVHGACGIEGLRPASGPIDCGNSGTTMRVLAGLLATQLQSDSRA